MDHHIQRCILIFIAAILFFAVPYFVYTYADDASTSASGCFILNEGNLPTGFSLPAECGSAGGPESAVVQKVIALAQTHLKTGIYVWGSPNRNWADDKSTGPNSPANFDCSGFVGWSWYWGSNGAISMSGQTNADWDSTNPRFQRIITNNEAQFKPGDLIYFNFGSDPPDHVGMYVGKDSSKYSCGANDCFVQYYQSGLPGNEVSLKSLLPNVMGVIRIKNI